MKNADFYEIYITSFRKAIYIGLLVFCSLIAKAQCDYIPCTSTATDTLSYSFSGGTFGAYSCPPIDPNYWFSGSGKYVLITFVHPQAYPTFRVWGMNTDDSARVSINGSVYPLDSNSASYDAKVLCGQSPGPDGVTFLAGHLTGTSGANYSYQNIKINTVNVSTMKIESIGGAGWGFAGVSVNCFPTGVGQSNINPQGLVIYPNPVNNKLTIQCTEAGSTVKIFNTLGEQVYKGFLSSPKEIIDVSSFARGVYFLQVANKAGGKELRKFVKE